VLLAIIALYIDTEFRTGACVGHSV